MEKNIGTIIRENGKIKIKDNRRKRNAIEDFIPNPKIHPQVKEGDKVVYLSFFTKGGDVAHIIKEKYK